MAKPQSLRNKTVRVTESEAAALNHFVLQPAAVSDTAASLDRVICGDLSCVVSRLSRATVDLLVLDPPYNLNKTFKTERFSRRDIPAYVDWMDRWFAQLVPILKDTATVYVCSDWSTSPGVYEVLARHLTIRNRVTWEREKGRGASANWKNCSEDIWFATVSDRYTFNVDAVRLKRRVVAPYREDGKAKGWTSETDGNFRLTAPSNLWTDITVPFWSMSENTEHPTQKPEKLIAKLILASSAPGDIVLDPFLGSGTTAVVCKKLDRRFIGIDLVPEYCAVAVKRLQRVRPGDTIQGYEQGVFLERNTMQLQMQSLRRSRQPGLFSDAAE